MICAFMTKPLFQANKKRYRVGQIYADKFSHVSATHTRRGDIACVALTSTGSNADLTTLDFGHLTGPATAFVHAQKCADGDLVRGFLNLT